MNADDKDDDDPFRPRLPEGDPFARERIRAADAGRRRLPGCVVLCCLLAIAAAIVWVSPLPKKLEQLLIEFVDSRREAPAGGEPEVVIRERVVEQRVEVPVPVPTPAEPPPMPDGPVRYRRIEVAELFNGIRIESDLQSEEGDVASLERRDPESYLARFELKVRVPRPNTTLEQLTASNPALPKVLKGFPLLVESAKVSNYFHHLYDLKQRQLQANLTRLETVLSRHNFYDCDTVLEIEHPNTGRRVFFLQGEMDVVSDGSDGDRLPEFDRSIAGSAHFQPSTSYGWPKRTDKVNPMIAILEANLEKHRERYKVKGLTRTENAFLEAQISAIPKQIADLRSRSYLIAQSDPFIVIPLSTRPYLDTNPFMPRIGDYAVVIHGEKLFPAIVGDYGPTTKTGEASLRMAREIDPQASPYRRPISDLTVSYLVFPGTAERPFGPPDLAKWHRRCGELLTEIGGIGEGFALHEWEDHFAPEPEPEPPVVPAPDPILAAGEGNSPADPPPAAEGEGGREGVAEGTEENGEGEQPASSTDQDTTPSGEDGTTEPEPVEDAGAASSTS